MLRRRRSNKTHEHKADATGPVHVEIVGSGPTPANQEQPWQALSDGVAEGKLVEMQLDGGEIALGRKVGGLWKRESAKGQPIVNPRAWRLIGK